MARSSTSYSSTSSQSSLKDKIRLGINEVKELYETKKIRSEYIDVTIKIIEKNIRTNQLDEAMNSLANLYKWADSKIEIDWRLKIIETNNSTVGDFKALILALLHHHDYMNATRWFKKLINGMQSLNPPVICSSSLLEIEGHVAQDKAILPKQWDLFLQKFIFYKEVYEQFQIFSLPFTFKNKEFIRQIYSLNPTLRKNMIEQLNDLSPDLAGFLCFILHKQHWSITSEAKKYQDASITYYKEAIRKKIILPSTLRFMISLPEDKTKLKALAETDDIFALSKLADSYLAIDDPTEENLLNLSVIILSYFPSLLRQISHFKPGLDFTAEENNRILHLLRIKSFYKIFRDGDLSLFLTSPNLSEWIKIITIGHVIEMVVSSVLERRTPPHSKNIVSALIFSSNNLNLYIEFNKYYTKIFGKESAPPLLNPLIASLVSIQGQLLMSIKEPVSVYISTSRVRRRIVHDLIYLLNSIPSELSVFQRNVFKLMIREFYPIALKLKFLPYLKYLKESRVRSKLAHEFGFQKILEESTRAHEAADSLFITFLILLAAQKLERSSSHLNKILEIVEKTSIDKNDYSIFYAALKALETLYDKNHFVSPERYKVLLQKFNVKQDEKDHSHRSVTLRYSLEHRSAVPQTSSTIAPIASLSSVPSSERSSATDSKAVLSTLRASTPPPATSDKVIKEKIKQLSDNIHEDKTETKEELKVPSSEEDAVIDNIQRILKSDPKPSIDHFSDESRNALAETSDGLELTNFFRIRRREASTSFSPSGSRPVTPVPFVDLSHEPESPLSIPSPLGKTSP